MALLTLSQDEIIERMRRGERLRWLPASVIDRKVKVDQRFLFIGKDELDGESQIRAVGLERMGLITEINDHTGLHIVDYVLNS